MHIQLAISVFIFINLQLEISCWLWGASVLPVFGTAVIGIMFANQGRQGRLQQSNSETILAVKLSYKPVFSVIDPHMKLPSLSRINWTKKKLYSCPPTFFFNFFIWHGRKVTTRFICRSTHKMRQVDLILRFRI